MILNIFEATRHINENYQCHMVDVIEDIVEETTENESPTLPIERVIIKSVESIEEELDEEVEECVR